MFILTLSLRPWRLAPVSHLFSSAAVGVLLLLMGFLFWMQTGLRPVLAKLQGEQVVTAYLDPAVGAKDEDKIVDSIRSSLGAHSVSAEVKFVSSKDFVSNLRGTYPDLSRELEDLGNEMSAVVPRYVSVSGILPVQALERIKSVPGIESAESSKDRYAQIVGAFLALRWVAKLLILGVGLALLTGLVHLSRINAFMHRDALMILKQWGAGPGALRAPSMVSGALVGALGGALAFVGWLTTGTVLTHQIRALSPLLRDMPSSGFIFAVGLLFAGILIGLFAGALGGLTQPHYDREQLQLRGGTGLTLVNCRLIFMALVLTLGSLFGAARADVKAKASLADRLSGIRTRVISLESNILDSLKTQKRAQASMTKIQKLLELQRQERELGKKRLGELEAKVLELETRRGVLAEKIKAQQSVVRVSLVALESSTDSGQPSLPSLSEAEKLEAPRRKTLANLSDRGLKEVEALRVDLGDAEQLENRIQEEKQQLAYLFQDLQEQASILELNRALQLDVIQKKHDERLTQLENYRRLKTSEQQVEHLIGQFNSRLELEHENEVERHVLGNVNRSMGEFARLKGRLGLPVADGKVISVFGRGFDPKSRLFIFKKGIDIATAKNAGVRAISVGKVAYSGELPEYGRVAIVDHGEHFYTICAHLGELKKKAGDPVAAGDLIGSADESGTPVYFEIRARNVAVNPLQWVSNETILAK